jgi:TRAP-type C4-dicarboxylate transport system permease small subunit
MKLDLRLVAIVLIVVGLFGLAYGSFTYTKDSHGFKVGSLEVAVKDRETINIPLWLSVGALAAGGVLLLSRRRGGATV